MDKIIIKILKKLEDNNYSAFVVGGYVRDKIIGIESHDVDICTNALPKDVIEILNLKKSTKSQFGSINIKTRKYNIDITTYRKEEKYIKHKPTSIKYINDVKCDLYRRDFTCNAILINKDEEVIDYFNGIKDINDKVIKCIGDTSEKLSQDPLRILRAIRFSIIYNFNLDEEILFFIKNNKSLLNTVSNYRIREEIDKILSSNNRLYGLELIKHLELFEVLKISYEKINDCKDILGIYAQMNIEDDFLLTKNERNIINNIRNILKIKNISNETLYKYGLYENLIAADILGINNNIIHKKYKKMPIKCRKDIKINAETIVKLKNNSYNNINEIFNDLETKILKGELNNKTKDIIKYIRKEV